MNTSGWLWKIVDPIPMELWCPVCKARHMDEGPLSVTPCKRSIQHTCAFCAHVWMPTRHARTTSVAKLRESNGLLSDLFGAIYRLQRRIGG
jgi:hypothetical protein